jgi:hypothetical protein
MSIRRTMPVGAAALRLLLVVPVFTFLGACGTVQPIAGLAIHGQAEPLMGMIRSGRIGVDDPQPWHRGKVGNSVSSSVSSSTTPLCAAISSGNEDAVRELLGRGADANKTCTRHHTPLDWTIETFYQPAALDIAGMLLARGAMAMVYRGADSLAGVQEAMARKNSALGQPVLRKG